MKVQVFAQNGRVIDALKIYPELCRTFEDWLVKYSNYVPYQDESKKKRLNYETKIVFNVSEYESYQKCVIEYISGMTDQFAINAFNEIITF